RRLHDGTLPRDARFVRPDPAGSLQTEVSTRSVSRLLEEAAQSWRDRSAARCAHARGTRLEDLPAGVRSVRLRLDGPRGRVAGAGDRAIRGTGGRPAAANARGHAGDRAVE